MYAANKFLKSHAVCQCHNNHPTFLPAEELYAERCAVNNGAVTRPATDGNEVGVAGAVARVDCRLLVGASAAMGRAVAADGTAVVLSCEAGNPAVSLLHVLRWGVAIK